MRVAMLFILLCIRLRFLNLLKAYEFLKHFFRPCHRDPQESRSASSTKPSRDSSETQDPLPQSPRRRKLQETKQLSAPSSITRPAPSYALLCNDLKLRLPRPNLHVGQYIIKTDPEFWIFMFLVWGFCSTMIVCCLLPLFNWVHYFVYPIFPAI
ncbi:hypothetical protein TARUN_1695 [Trichoderma arundinaceum]|uniref:Uncharacterized protein n=1 Tax=Trichoderma arundinaceum TaxID=490622 RepID=A0A395NWR4_TRIAR|nr:hypothetical protein TARUN_1695 [Trichoderma arundinaceum]